MSAVSLFTIYVCILRYVLWKTHHCIQVFSQFLKMQAREAFLFGVNFSLRSSGVQQNRQIHASKIRSILKYLMPTCLMLLSLIPFFTCNQRLLCDHSELLLQCLVVYPLVYIAATMSICHNPKFFQDLFYGRNHAHCKNFKTTKFGVPTLGNSGGDLRF